MSLFTPSLIHLSCLAVIASPAFAQASAPATAASSATSHTHDPTVTLDQFVTSASPFPRNQVELAQATTVLSGSSLLMKKQASLGETLAAETGIAATSFGPGASRPIIRGLGGDRIRLLENGVGTMDASVTSPDHGVSVEPFLIERVEVLRGPAALLYGSNAVGGAVNVITHRIETNLPDRKVRGGLEVRGDSASGEFSRGAVTDLAVEAGEDRAVVFHVDAFRRDTRNLRIPGFAESARLRAEEAEEAAEHGEELVAPAHGRLPNSSLNSESGAAGLSFVGNNFHLGASYSAYDSRYGVPGHTHAHAHDDNQDHEHDHDHADVVTAAAEGVRIGLRQRRTDVQGAWEADTGWVQGVRFKAGHASYRHTEYEPDGAIGTVFTNRGFDGRVEVLHGNRAHWSGAIGAHATRSDFAAEGEEAFLPPSLTKSFALFAFEEITTEPLTWQFGARVERSTLRSRSQATSRTTSPSGSIGVVWKLDDTHSVALSVAHTRRAPNAQERFADGPHAGTQAYEVGDPDLKSEKSLGIDFSIRRNSGRVTGAITVFANQFDGYITEQPTGLIARDHDGEWEFSAPDTSDVSGSGLPVYQTVQRDAHFWGAEVETLWHLHDHPGWQLDLRLAADLTRAREGGRNLPRIPAARTMVGLLWSTAQWNAGVEWQRVHAQDRTALNETASDGYDLISAHVSRGFTIGPTRMEIFARGSNLANEEARPHPSFVKDLAPLAGRSASAGVRLAF